MTWGVGRLLRKPWTAGTDRPVWGWVIGVLENILRKPDIRA